MTNKTKRMYSIILKEKGDKNDWLSIDVDQVIPTFPFGEQFPVLMAIVDDRSYFIPLSQLNWFEQNFGAEKDTEMAKAMIDEKRKRKGNPTDASFN